jgi:putative tricarboxylic transport membrane protein
VAGCGGAVGGPSDGVRGRGVGVAGVEVVTSLLLVAIGAVALWDSRRTGAGWAGDGPQAGYFPFWIGLVLILASLGNLVQVLRGRAGGGRFASWSQLRLVLAVLGPAVAYVAGIPVLGFYAASTLLVAYFMVALGGFSWRAAVPTGAAVAVVAFLTFEVWFLVPLPKGPVETLLGY